mmetsp:Transcript_15649/g.19540  ORF Transcript_15649/g.19540 Transcript_15649/m.19540 type:complete len:107 (-) Transcript_15649:35-355(-)
MKKMLSRVSLTRTFSKLHKLSPATPTKSRTPRSVNPAVEDPISVYEPGQLLEKFDQMSGYLNRADAIVAQSKPNLDEMCDLLDAASKDNLPTERILDTFKLIRNFR